MNAAKLAVVIIGASMLLGQLGFGISTVMQQLADERVSITEDSTP